MLNRKTNLDHVTFPTKDKSPSTARFKTFLLAMCLASGSAVASDAPSIGGKASINVNVVGGVVNAGGGTTGFVGTVKQAVGSVLSGSIEGALQTNVSVKGGLINVGAGASGAKVTACQSIGTVGSNCNSGGT